MYTVFHLSYEINMNFNKFPLLDERKNVNHQKL